jgi:hypothetical protein
MGFNLNNFINTTSQSIANRALTAVSSKVDNALGGGVTGLLSGILSSGASAQSLLSIASLGADRLIGNLESEFFGAIGLGDKSKGRLPSDLLQDTNVIANVTDSMKLQFPKDLGVYGISFTFSRYSRPTPLVSTPGTITKAIYLPLPRELQTQHQIQYSAEGGGLTTGIADMVYQGMDAKGKGREHDNLRRGSILAGSLVESAATGIADGLLGLSTAATVGQVFGAIPNPNATVAYSGPTLRTFQFSWSFSPNNKDESDTLITIFNEIKKRSLAGFTAEGSSAYLSYPDSVNIQVLPKQDGAIGDLMKFKKAMITSINIDYAPEGAAFFKGTQSPTFFEVSLSFQEIEYFVSSAYGGSDNVGISSDGKKIIHSIADTLTSKLSEHNPLDDQIKGAIDRFTNGFDALDNSPGNPAQPG